LVYANLLERKVYPALASKDSLYCFYLDGLWKDLGLPETFIKGSKEFIQYIWSSDKNYSFAYFKEQPSIPSLEKCSYKIFNDYILLKDFSIFKGLNLVHKNYFINEHENLVESFENQNVSIGPFCVIESHCKFSQNVKISNSVLMYGVVLGESVVVDNSIIANDSVVGKNAQVVDLSVLGEGSQISDGQVVTHEKISVLNAK
jgi:NDP-sugar pyrophosphorylase family protein